MQTEDLDAISLLVVLDLTDPQRLFKICEAVHEFHQKNTESKAVTYGFIGTKHDIFEVTSAKI